MNQNIDLTDYVWIAKAVTRKYGWFGRNQVTDSDDYGEAMLGLADAYKTHDPTKIKNFAHYAYGVCIHYLMRYHTKLMRTKRHSRTARVVSISEDNSVHYLKDRKASQDSNSVVLRDLLQAYNNGDTTQRDLNIIDLILHGYTLREIGKQLGVSFQRVGQITKGVFEHLRQLAGETSN